MTAQLDDLFKQIIQSEKKAQEKKEFLEKGEDSCL